MSQFHHFGVPTKTKQENESYLEDVKLYLTDAETHPYRVEFLRFEDGSPMHADVRNNPHVAFMVEDLAAALEGKNVIIEPFEATEALRVAFIKDNEAVIELMEKI
ncbi:MAG: hypothetical protein JXD22_05380 [Sedimentisphaerales bacterium]|nr:hypothetical protein [Sedimentisphaerales bacterium]